MSLPFLMHDKRGEIFELLSYFGILYPLSLPYLYIVVGGRRIGKMVGYICILFYISIIFIYAYMCDLIILSNPFKVIIFSYT